MLPVKEYLKKVVRIKNPSKSRRDCLRLDKNENPVDFPPEFVQMVKDSVTSEFLSMYPEIDPLYDRIAQWLDCKNENLFIAAGSDGAIKTVFEAFVEPGDKVMVLDPTYAMYYVYSNLFQAQLVPIQYEKNLQFNVTSALEQIKETKPKLVCIANPNSPTGTAIPMQEIEKMISLCRDLNTIFLLDEAYFVYWPESGVPLIKNYNNLVVTRSFSKALGLAAARLGVAIGHADVIQPLHSWRPMYEVNGLAVNAGILALDHFHLLEARVKKALEGKTYLEAQLTERGIPFHKSAANFVHIRVGSFEKAVEMMKKLQEKNILVMGGFKQEALKDCLRVSIGDKNQMIQFLSAFWEVLM